METNQQGQLLGAKGRQTRDRLLTTAAKLLKSRSPSELTVLEIAKKAKASPATFYLYFKDTEDAIFALAEQASAEVRDTLVTFEGDWDEEETLKHTRSLVIAFQKAWRNHREVLRARNAEADRGNNRFYYNRLHSAMPVLEAFAKRIAKHQKIDQSNFDTAFALASVLYTAMERLAATNEMQRHAREVTADMLREAQARLIASTMSNVALWDGKPDETDASLVA
ncbi:MAG: TetR/AcrR family transcriptional regulator [Sphingorhabdus sp.]